jgi:PP-loop superfamily ATP-utilizing enzyme
MNTETQPEDRLSRARHGLTEFGITDAVLTEHTPILRIQLSEADFDRAIERRDAIVEAMKAIGYRFVALDLDV